jgi:hypothetical protein
LLVALLALVVLAGCQVHVNVEVEAADDGSGTVTVRVGFDDGALTRLGDPSTALRLDDLAQANWRVTGPKKDSDDGLTWWTASKPFANADELAVVLSEVAGPEVVRDVRWDRTETDDDVTVRLQATIDLTTGVQAFSDADVAAALDGDAFGGNITQIEAQEGRPVADMVSAQVDVDVAGVQQSFNPSLADAQPVAVDVTAVKAKPTFTSSAWLLGAVALAAVVLVGTGLLAARRRFGTSR